MSLWYCEEHGLVGPQACCPKASWATITEVNTNGSGSLPMTADRPQDALEETPLSDMERRSLMGLIHDDPASPWSPQYVQELLKRYEATVSVVEAENAALKNDPMQPLAVVDGVIRFRANPLVRWLLDEGGKNMNDLTRECIRRDWPERDRRQFAQLIGYSVSGYSELSYVDDAAYERAEPVAEALRAALVSPPPGSPPNGET